MSDQNKGHSIAVLPQPEGAVEETSFSADVDAQLLPEEGGQSTPQLEAQPVGPDADTPNQDTIRRYGSTNAPEQPPGTGASKSPARALAPDLLRGLLMLFMAIDHNALGLLAWPQGTPLEHESDGLIVHKWIGPLQYILRTLSHLCAPGFTFLLGMGVVYFGRSRRNLGWSSGQMAWHFFVRAVVLTALTTSMGFLLSVGRIWFLNVVLFALGVDYLLAGLLWLALSRTEQTLAWAVLKVLPDAKQDDQREPLLQTPDDRRDIASDRKLIRAADISWHAHNAVLLLLSVVTIWWNMWLSPTGGYCNAEEATKTVATGLPSSNWFRIWFYTVETSHILSVFPPLGWLSFAILGLLYGRITLARSWNTRAIAIGNLTAGVMFVLVFLLTRILHFGNLSEGCLRTPEHLAHPSENQYLVSAESFFYIVKYPPDIAFWSFTTGVNFLLLALFSVVPPHVGKKWGALLLVFGNSALFFYIFHQFVVFGFGTLARLLVGHPTGITSPLTGEEGMGVDSLWWFWGTFVLSMTIMYCLCHWYWAFKKTKGPNSLWRFF